MKTTAAALPIVLACLTGCGPSPADLIEDYRAGYGKRREQLKQFAARMPAKGSVRANELPKPLDPPLVLKRQSDDSNTECLMVEELTDPKARPQFNVKLNSNLTTARFWMTKTSHGSGDADHMEQTLRRGLDARYLLVHRVAEITLPKPLGKKLFAPGRAVIENFLFDVKSGEIVGRFRVVAETSDQVRYAYKPSQSAEERLRSFARSTMWSDARRKIAATLKDLTNGTVEVD